MGLGIQFSTAVPRDTKKSIRDVELGRSSFRFQVYLRVYEYREPILLLQRPRQTAATC